MENEFIVYNSPIGYIKIVGNKDYIMAIEFHDKDPGGLISDEDENPLMQLAYNQVKDYFESGRKEFTFPILQPGTHFQMAVWKELLDIPYGKKITYLQLAKNLGDIKKTRAVGNANGKNNITIVVPCHRVIGTDDDLTGYAGGLWRKEWLLMHEGALPKKLF